MINTKVGKRVRGTAFRPTPIVPLQERKFTAIVTMPVSSSPPAPLAPRSLPVNDAEQHGMCPRALWE